MPEVNPAIEAVFAEHGRGGVRMPPKVYVTLVENGDFRTLLANPLAQGIAGVKIVNVHPYNRAKGLSTVMALTIIIDITTGIPTVIINTTEFTAIRTGASARLQRNISRPATPSPSGSWGSDDRRRRRSRRRLPRS